MAAGLHLMVTKFLVRSCRNRWNLQIFFWVEKHLRFSPLTGPNMRTIGQVSMTSQNMFYPTPWKSQIGKTQFSLQVWQISKNSKIQKVLISKFGAVASSFGYC